jgi:hypothetical protein
VAEDGFMAATMVPGWRRGVAGGPIEPELVVLLCFCFLEAEDILRERDMSI